ncbi:hypothetical protein BC940DRAFT_313096 [Gongronella butleri]|nr:hypothetical protein BC940DRAFT_313096 [Gongronella butleri]
MAGHKRVKADFDPFAERASSIKAKRSRRRSPELDSADDIDDDDDLEFAKQRRGAVKDVYASDDEQVGFSSESEREEAEGDAPSNKKDDNDDDDDMDMFASAEAKAPEPKAKSKKLTVQDVEGQEMTSRDIESDEEDNQDKVAISAFHMRQEMEEGSFDQQGNYVRNSKDPQAFHDQWMAGISKKDMAKAKEAQRKKNQEEADKEALRQAALPQTQADCYRAILEYMLPGESVREALTKQGEGKKVPLWKQKLEAKKNKNKPQIASNKTLTPEEEERRKQNVEAITEIANQLLALGHYQVYDDTYELMVRHLRARDLVPENWVPTSSHRR